MFHKIFNLMIFVLCLVFIPYIVPANAKHSHPDHIPRINVVDLSALQGRQSVVFVDTRTPGQWQQAVDKISGALRVTSQTELDEFKRTVPTDTTVVTYCT